jgi:predicted HicB family RNase H-like nuclease
MQEEGREKRNMTSTQSVNTKPKLGRPRNSEAPKFLQLRLPRELHEKMKERAAADAMELNVWIRWVCLQELRRRKPSL